VLSRDTRAGYADVLGWSRSRGDIESQPCARYLQGVAARHGVVRLSEADPDLAENLPAEVRERATGLMHARAFRVRKGPWQPPEIDRRATLSRAIV
jgi:hypothetical protein